MSALSKHFLTTGQVHLIPPPIGYGGSYDESFSSSSAPLLSEHGLRKDASLVGNEGNELDKTSLRNRLGRFISYISMTEIPCGHGYLRGVYLLVTGRAWLER